MVPLNRMTPATADVLRALLDASSATWGLLVVKHTGRPTGSVYPILERLEGSGWVTSSWEDDPKRPGPRRRLYELTPEGVEAAQTVIAQFQARARVKTTSTALVRPAKAGTAA